MGNLSSVKKVDINGYCLKQSLPQKTAGRLTSGRKTAFIRMQEPNETKNRKLDYPVRLGNDKVTRAGGKEHTPLPH